MRADIAQSVFSATVAVKLTSEDPKHHVPVVGTAFCIDGRGIMVTAAHVLEDYLEPDALLPLDHLVANKEFQRYGGALPSVVFWVVDENRKFRGWEVPVNLIIVLKREDRDTAIFSIDPIPPFRRGFPALPLMDVESVWPGMDVGVCGYPHAPFPDQLLRIKTPMLAQGIVGSVAPFPGVRPEHLRHFQLDINSGKGGSGGPAFSVRNGHVFGVVQGGMVVPGEEEPRQGVVRVDPIAEVTTPATLELLLMRSHQDEARYKDDWMRDRAREIYKFSEARLAKMEEMRRR